VGKGKCIVIIIIIFDFVCFPFLNQIINKSSKRNEFYCVFIENKSLFIGYLCRRWILFDVTKNKGLYMMF